MPFQPYLHKSFILQRKDSFLDEHNVIFPEKFDFRRGCLTLLKLYDHLLTQNGSSQTTDAVFLRISKALYYYGIRGVENCCFRSYLNNKEQSVFINQQRST